MRRLVALGLLLVFWTTAVTAAPVPITENDQRDVMVTVYNGNLGLVKDTRDARLDAGTLEVKVMVLPALPENLVSKPTLVWLLRNARPAPQRIEASYLTGGITWKADYVMVINAAETRSDLTGWVTIDNKSGATYKNAALKLVAGDI